MNQKITDFATNLSLIYGETDDEATATDHQIEVIAKKQGFVSRQPGERLLRRKAAEPSANLNIRPPVTTFNRFVVFCETNRYSYPEALKELLDRAKF